MSVSFHLCQPGGGASCGACCGLYNFRDHSREALAQRLARHTARLQGVAREPAAFRKAARASADEDRALALFPAVRICPLLGFLPPDGSGGERVGCLAHPRVTGGVDLRDCGVYRAEVCETFTCPSFGWLSDAQARLVQAACADWYLYGLVITDVEFVQGCLRLLAWECGREVPCEALLAHGPALAALRRLFALKEAAAAETRGAAPGGARAGGVFGRFRPDADGEPQLQALDYAALGAHAAPEDDVVVCLGHLPADGSALERARAQVRSHVRAVAAALEG
ncbi:hypothetical protein FGE12_11725 [Aggregicoccus sp. 17bor-14]|uniref:hypothetical protein n=1 Tax=Myxococcaceae TaxID=31 RepID=UPI00129CCCE8|nr:MULTISPECIES: hypothetical protein [Myxococcaceae]MBF5043057.1 hypothetical protein [Simulacricoccus sp. 17bor-14]MRI88820.1 hypothetical protein [Aggregicoccus sp. 17bor-14]